jgi:hypothetical protein
MANLKISPVGGTEGFALKEAFALMNQNVVKKTDLKKPPTLEQLGYVAGVVSLNDEIEVLIKFIDELMQINKSQFQRLMKVVNDD